MTTPTSLHRSGRARRPRLLGRGALACGLALSLLLAAALPARGEGAAGPPSVLETLREKRKLQEEQQEREFRKLIEEGRQLLAQRAYAQAKRVLGQAAKLRPGDEACTRLLAQAEAAKPTIATAEQLLTRVRDEQQSKNALLHVQLGASLFEAEKALKAGDHGRALEHAERVLDSVAYVTEADRAAKLRSQAQTILASARAASDRAKSAELQSVLAAHKERAAQDKTSSLLALNSQGWQQLDQGNADEALATAEAMLRLEPGNRQGLFLRQRAREAAGQGGDIAALRERRKEAEKKLLVDQLDDELIVPKDAKAKVVLPGKRQPSDFVRLDERGHEPWEQQFRAKLRQPVEVELRNATVAEACRYLSQASECTMVVDPAVAQDTKRVTLPKMTMTLEHALRWVCRFSKATYTLRDHAILVTTRGGLLDQPLTRNYDLTSLLIPTRCIRTTFNAGTQADDQSWGTKELVSSARPATREEETKQVSEDVLGEAWVRFIRNTVAPETWEDGDRGAVQQQQQPYSINYRNGRIVVVHVPEVHEQVERLLNDFRRARNLQVHIFARFLVIQTDFLERFDLDLVGEGFDLATDDLTLVSGTSAADVYGFTSDPQDIWQQGADPPRRSAIGYLFNDSMISVGGEGELSASGPLSIRWAHVGGNTVNALLQAVVKKRKGTLLTAPRLTCFNTQRANFQAVTNYNYIRSLNADGEPEIGNVPDGIIFDVQPFVSSDRRYITLVLQPQMRTLRNSATLQTSGFTYATTGLIAYRRVNLPDTELRSVATTVTIPDGGTMLVGGLSTVRERSGEAGVPFLNGIPLLRFLLREWTQFDSRQSLLVLVTAEIVPDIFEE